MPLKYFPGGAAVKQIAVQTFTATIYVGLKNRDTGEIYHIERAKQWLQDFCTRHPLCVTLTPTEFIYVYGSEPGFIVGLINYPRFPANPSDIKEHAYGIAAQLKNLFNQYKVSVVFPDETVMLSTEPGE